MLNVTFPIVLFERLLSPLNYLEFRVTDKVNPSADLKMFPWVLSVLLQTSVLYSVLRCKEMAASPTPPPL